MDMDLKAYFDDRAGMGVLATADAAGLVDAAIYSRPHVMDKGEVAFIMNDRRSLANVRANPNAAYLFKEDGPGYKGVRVFLTMESAEKDSPLIAELKRRKADPARDAEAGSRYLVRFRVEKVVPLIGAGE